MANPYQPSKLRSDASGVKEPERPGQMFLSVAVLMGIAILLYVSARPLADCFEPSPPAVGRTFYQERMSIAELLQTIAVALGVLATVFFVFSIRRVAYGKS